MRIALDSNILLYMARVWKVEADKAKTERLDQILPALAENAQIVAPFQVLGECYHVMQRFGYPREQCREIVTDWRDQIECVESTVTAFADAIDLATDHKLQFWDALILCAAADVGCTLLLSEDMQPGFTWRGLRVVNPFAAKLDTRLKRVLAA